MDSQAAPFLKQLGPARGRTEPSPAAGPATAGSATTASATVTSATRRAAGPRVLMVVESSSGGTGRHVLDLSEGLARRGCDVHVLYSTGRADRFFLDRIKLLPTVRCVPLPMRTSIHPSDFAAVRAARRYADEFGPFDAIHGHSSKGGAVARLAAFGKEAAAFYTLHGFIIMDPLLARWKRAFYLAVELALALRTSRIIAVAPEERREAVRLGLGKNRVALIPNGVGAPQLTPRTQARRAIGVEDADAPVIGFVGRFVTQKAPDLLVRAMAIVAARCPQARLALVGTGPLEAELRDLVRALGLGDKVLWLGERPANSVLAAFDVFAMSSRKEGLPYVVLEAMSAGLPVVATDSSGVDSLVAAGENGIVVPRGDAAAFGDALATLAVDPALRERYGRGSLARVRNFTIDAMVDQTLALYEEALAGRAAAAVPAPAKAGRADSPDDLALAAVGAGEVE
jgi:glycosyltransferase involved in cell wall biosynthesis